MMTQEIQIPKAQLPKTTIISFFEEDGKLYEQGYDNKDLYFIAWYPASNHVGFIAEFADKNGYFVQPIQSDALAEGVVLLPTKTQEFGSVEALVEEIKAHIHKYLDIPIDFEEIAAYYILMSWIYDKLTTVPFLRALGDTGTGKSRFLDVIGRLCYKACMVSGALTPAPIYRVLKQWHGTLVIDEADFSDSSEKAEVIKILNCGFEKGKAVIRCKKDNPDELQFLPTFSPKVIATRQSFDDKALESRCLTCVMKETDRGDIAAILPKEFYEEEAELRAKLLMFRFKHRDKINTDEIQKIKLGEIEPRLRQATASFAVLFANIDGLMVRFREFLKDYNRKLVEERSGTIDGLIIRTLFELKEDGLDAIAAKDIADKLTTEHNEKVTPQKIGSRFRSLRIRTRQTKIFGKVARLVVWDNAIMERLKKRYIPEIDGVDEVADGSNGRGDCPKERQLSLRALEESVEKFENVLSTNGTNVNRRAVPHAEALPLVNGTNVNLVNQDTPTFSLNDEDNCHTDDDEVEDNLDRPDQLDQDETEEKEEK